MLHRRDNFSLTLLGPDNELVDCRTVTDFVSIYEDMRFSAAVRGWLPNDGRMVPGALAAAWRNGEFAGLAASLGEASGLYPLGCFRYEIWDLLQAHGLLGKVSRQGGSFRAVLSVERNGAATAKPPGFTRCITADPYPLDRRPIRQFGVRTELPEAQPLTLCVSAALLSELLEITRSNPARECLSLLSGHVVLCPGSQVAVVLTGRQEVRDTMGASASRFGISSTALLEAVRANKVKACGGVICGWHHNHPAGAADDADGVARTGDGSSVFLSVDDHSVFRTWFRAPYFVGLVSGWAAGPPADGLVIKAYGWRQALVEEIPYRTF